MAASPPTAAIVTPVSNGTTQENVNNKLFGDILIDKQGLKLAENWEAVERECKVTAARRVADMLTDPEKLKTLYFEPYKNRVSQKHILLEVREH